MLGIHDFSPDPYISQHKRKFHYLLEKNLLRIESTVELKRRKLEWNQVSREREKEMMSSVENAWWSINFELGLGENGTRHMLKSRPIEE